MNVAVSPVEREDIDESAIGALAASILTTEGVPHDASLSITFVSQADISDLNERFMGKAGPTDVLSFPIEDASPDTPPLSTAGGPPLELGDIFICPEIVDAHADEFGVAFVDELFLMVTHGVLHILGWDHQSEADAQAMESREARHLQTIGRTRR
ncbi:MAG: rRNA maturation RNase YbeY [Actinomycetia bacterium]|nr:rRNA maturation RNase YbeY [Actinomycetes bacterium]